MDEKLKTAVDTSDALHKNPTSFAWLVELNRLLNGDRERSLLQLQSVSAHIEKILDRADDVALARACFQDALRQIVQGWQPNERFTKEYLVCMLDLITAYSPLEGAAKVLGLLKRWGKFSDSIESSGGYGAESDLNLQALVALESYFPIGPHPKLLDQSRIFQNYVQLLFDYLVAPKYGGYAASRLISLEMIEVPDERIGQLIRSDPPALYELLSLFFSPPRKTQMRSDLQKIFLHVMTSTAEVTNLFEKVLKIHSARISDVHGGRQIVLADQSNIEILAETHKVQDATDSIKVPASLQRTRLNAQIYRVPALAGEATEESRKVLWQIFEHCLMGGSNYVEQFAYALQQAGGRLDHDNRKVHIVFSDGTRFGETLVTEARLAYMVWFSRSYKVPATKTIIRKLEAAAQAETAASF